MGGFRLAKRVDLWYTYGILFHREAKRAMKKNWTSYLATAVAAAAVLTLCALAVVYGRTALTQHQSDTLKILLIVCGCAAAYCFFVGELANNFSQMDKLWSLLPIAYTWIVAVRGGMQLRLALYALLVTAWGVRLTFNFARKGAYSRKFWSGVEDYRWAIVRNNSILRHRPLWTLFDLFFISIYQNALVLAICLPALASMESTATFGWRDAIPLCCACGFLLLETLADEQQWRFHETRKKLLNGKQTLSELPAPYDLGFNTTGLWGRMRHPNYLGEQGIWLSLYFVTLGAQVTNCGGFHWSMVGPLLLILLFMGSSSLGESISAKKYPQYTSYVRQVFKYLPIRKFRREE